MTIFFYVMILIFFNKNPLSIVKRMVISCHKCNIYFYFECLDLFELDFFVEVFFHLFVEYLIISAMMSAIIKIVSVIYNRLHSIVVFLIIVSQEEEYSFFRLLFVISKSKIGSFVRFDFTMKNHL